MPNSPDTVDLKLDRSTHTNGRHHDRSAWFSEIVLEGLMRACNCVIVITSALFAHVTRLNITADIDLPEAMVIIVGMMLAIYMPIAPMRQVQHHLFLRPSLNILRHWGILITSIYLLIFITRSGQSISREWLVFWFFYGLFGLVAVHALFDHRIRRWRRRGLLTTNIAVVGAGDVGHRLIQYLARAPDPSVRLIGVFYDNEVCPAKESAGGATVDARDDLLRFARSNHIDQVIVALPWHAENRLLLWLKTLRALPVDILLCPPVLSPWLSSSGVPQVGSVPLLKISERPLSGWKCIIKAAEDRFLALLLLLLTGPAMLLIALVVRLDSPGPALFRQKRHGFNNSLIEVLKFRTMRTDVAESGIGSITQARPGDPRVTRVGRWLRRTSLDELPQLINVFRGQMSLVGPRPHAVAHNEQYQKSIDAYPARHRVKPGITGWAQVNGFRGETDTDEKMIRRVEYDLYYIDHWSLLFDFSIIARTAFGGFVHPNAY